MIFQTLPWFLVAGFFACCGCAIAALVLDQKHKDERRKLEKDMTEKLRERYETYVVLENQVKRVVGEFEGHDRISKELVAVQKEHIQRLKAALAQQEGPQPAAASTANVQSSLSWMDGADQNTVEVVSNDEHDAQHPELAALRKKLESVQAEHQADVDRERRALTETAIRLARLEPLQEQVRKLELALASSGTELESWKSKCAELERNASLETTRLKARVDSLEPLALEVAKARTVVDEWQAKSAELAAEKAREIGALQERLAAVQPLAEELEAARSAARTWEERASAHQNASEIERKQTQALRDELEVTHKAKDLEVQHLRGELASVEGRLTKAQADVELATQLKQTLTAQVENLERSLGCARVDLEEARRSLEHEKNVAAELTTQVEKRLLDHDSSARELEMLRAQCNELTATCSNQSNELRAFEERERETSAKHTARLCDCERELDAAREALRGLEQRRTELEERCGALGTELVELTDRDARRAQETGERIAELERDISAKAVSIDDLEMRRAELDLRCRDLSAELDAANRRSDELATAHATRVDQLERTVGATTAELGALEARRAELDARCGELTAQLAAAATREQESLARSNAELEHWRAQHAAASRDLEAAGQRTRELEDGTRGLEERLRALGAELEERVRALNTELSEVRSASQARLDERNGRVAALEGEVSALQSRCTGLDDQVRELAGRCDASAKSLEQRSQELADREQRLMETAARVEVLNLEISNAREAARQRDEALAGLSQRAERAESENQRHRTVMAAHAQQFEVAHSLLAELKPVIQNLENELTKEKVEGQAS